MTLLGLGLGLGHRVSQAPASMKMTLEMMRSTCITVHIEDPLYRLHRTLHVTGELNVFLSYSIGPSLALCTCYACLLRNLIFAGHILLVHHIGRIVIDMKAANIVNIIKVIKMPTMKCRTLRGHRFLAKGTIKVKTDSFLDLDQRTINMDLRNAIIVILAAWDGQRQI